MFCQKCGAQIPDNLAACASCNEPVKPVISVATAADKVKAASQDAWQALKTFAGNPVGGLSQAFESLGHVRALAAGIIFGSAFAICIVFGVYRLLPEWGGPQGFGGFIKILVVAIVPFISLLGASTIARKVFRGEGGFGHDSFISGASLLPYGCVAILAGILGIGNIEVIAVFTLIAICLNILMLFASLTRICKLSDRSATIAVPAMLMASTWLSKIIYSAMLK